MHPSRPLPFPTDPNPTHRRGRRPFFASLTVLVLGCVWSLVLGAAQAATLPDWESGAGFRSRPLALPASATGRSGFSLQPPAATGIAFANLVPEIRHLTNQIMLNGSGVAAGDVDGDGWCDLFFAGLDRGCRLYRNLGDWKFADITDAAGVGCQGITATGAALADLDGDGDLDLIVNSLGQGTHLFLNDGAGHFTQAATPLNGHQGGMSLALGDVDGDGFLDLYIANYRVSALMDIANARATFTRIDGRMAIETLNGRPATEPDLTNRFVVGPGGGIDELGEPDVLYHNAGGTNWTIVPQTGGQFRDEEGRPFTQPLYDWGLTAAFRDLNGDGQPDLYVCNDFHSPDRLWLNQGHGVLQLAPRFALRRTSEFSMAVDFADVNRDGHDDFLVLDMLSRDHVLRQRYMGDSSRAGRVIGTFDDRPQYGIDTLSLARGDGTFAEIAQLSGLEAAEWAWSCIFVDVDLDGWEDLLVANGMERAARDMDVAERMKMLRASKRLTDAEVFNARRMFPRLATPNLAFRNRGDLTFEENGAAWGFDQKGVSQGMALADLDNDGDADVVINNFNGPAGVFRNDGPAPRLAVRLKGLAPNTRGIGARILVRGGPVPEQSQEMIAGGRYLSSDDPIRTFAAGSATNQLAIEVLWRSGRRSVVAPAAANRLYEIDEAGASPAERAAPAPSAPWFEDASAALTHTHHDDPFDDLARQSLLPNLLSQPGPGVAWFDVNGDQREDLVIGTGAGGSLAIYTNAGAGQFTALAAPALTATASRDSTTVLGWTPVPGRTALLSGWSHYEEGAADGAALRQWSPEAASLEDLAPANESSAGAVAVADVDGDGALDVFLGGRVIPGRYPEPASSRLLRNQGGRLTPDPANAKTFERVGLVSGAVFSDLTGDGRPDLVLACEWGPLRIYRNEQGKLVPWDAPLVWPTDPAARPVTVATNPPPTLGGLTGWWTSVTAGDFDGDGRMDFVAGNWGRNSKYESRRAHPLELYAGEFGPNGSVDLVEAYYDPGLKAVVPARQLDVLSRALPFLRERYPSHRAFSQASVEDMLGDRLKTALKLQANTLESMVFLNRGDRFEARVLPIEAQFAPAFGLVVADFDGDGAEDLFLAQNFFATQPETPRYDAGRGLLLRGDGHGGFRAMPGQESGVLVYGEQRGAAAADYDADGRTDLVVTQNGAATRLFHNRQARPGLRVRLQGPPGNPTGIGALVRLGPGPAFGPAREIHAGAGYWSQDSAVIVLSRAEGAAQIWVRWPGGATNTAAIPDAAREIAVSPDGQVKVVR